MANKYLRAGASGSANGNDWTNAYTTLAALESGLARGDTGYVADGAYAGATFNTAASGTTLITIKKATVADHGTSTGWDDTYGDGQATFSSQFSFGSNYWEIDGVTGGGPGAWDTGHGFYVTETGASNAVIKLNGFDNITIRHTRCRGMANSGTNGGSSANDGVDTGGAENFTFSYGWLNNVGRCPVFSNSTGTMTFEYSYFDEFNFGSAVHGETAAVYGINSGSVVVTFRHNLITGVHSTGGIMWDNSASHSAQCRIYGNVFYRPSAATWSDNNGVIGGWTGGGGEDCYTMRVYQNSFVNINVLIFTNFITRFGDNIASDNLFYNCTSPDFSNIGTTHDYNHFINSGGTHSESNGTSAASGDPFVDFVGLDFRLKAASGSAAEALSSPYNVDMLGRTRGAYGVRDRGALEYVLEPPTGLGAT